MKSTYPDFEIIFVDDGSKDATLPSVKAAFAGNNKVKIFTKPNGGKASALNFGIAECTRDFVVCIDADTQLRSDAISELMKKVTDDTVDAVAGNVKVGNELNILTQWQSIEYITSQNFDRRAFDLLNAVTVVPGAIGVFRKKALLEAGGFTTDTLAEDCDLTIRLLKGGSKITYAPTAIAVTEVPETLKMFLKQRFRWTFGILQSLFKHKDALFNPTQKMLGLVALPNVLIFQFLLPILAPIADLLMLYSILTGQGSHVLTAYLLFLLVDGLGAALAFGFEGENMKRLIWLLPQRLVYRQLMTYVLFKALLKALKGELMSWGILKRTGNVVTDF